MDKKSSPSNANDIPTTQPAQPKTDRRRTARKPASANVEPGARYDAGQQAPNRVARQETSADLSQNSYAGQEFTPRPQTWQFESTPLEPSEHDIRLRAYHRYLERGAVDGADFDDWLQAEMELKKR
jgi:hypothetical protein